MHQPINIGLAQYQEDTLSEIELNQEGKASLGVEREAKLLPMNFDATKDEKTNNASESLSDMLST